MSRSLANLFAFVAGLVIAESAWAADFPARPVAPIFNWTGFHVGASAGYSLGRTDIDYAQAPAGGGGFGTGPCTAACTLSYSINPDSFIGGVELGYLYQTGIWVVGAETDFSWRDRDNSLSIVLNALKDTLTTTDRQRWVGTLRGNLGIAPAVASTWLFYVSGGLAYGHFEHSITQFCNRLCTQTVKFSDSKVKAGWTLGGGIAVAIDRNWSAGAEYLYMDFGTDTLSSSAGVGLPVIIPATSVDFRDRSHIARVTLNYRFVP